MRKLFRNAMGLALAATVVGPALAAPAVPVMCANFASSATRYDACVGLTSGNTSVAAANAAFLGDPIYSVEYKDNQTGTGSDSVVFDLLDNGNDSVTLKFLQNVGDGTSSTLVALKFGGQGVNQLGFFRFDNADFNVGQMLTFAWNPSFTGDGISHASVFSNIVTPGGGNVPEPGSAALVLAGIAALSLRALRPGGSSATAR